MTEQSVAKFRWLVGLVEADHALRRERLLLHSDGVPLASVTLEEVVQALVEGRRPMHGDARSERLVLIRASFLDRMRQLLALQEQEAGPIDLDGFLDDLFFEHQVGAQGYAARTLLRAALAVRRARRALLNACDEVAGDERQLEWESEDWDSEPEFVKVCLEEAEYEVVEKSIEAWEWSLQDEVA